LNGFNWTKDKAIGSDKDAVVLYVILTEQEKREWPTMQLQDGCWVEKGRYSSRVVDGGRASHCKQKRGKQHDIVVLKVFSPLPTTKLECCVRLSHKVGVLRRIIAHLNSSPLVRLNWPLIQAIPILP